MLRFNLVLARPFVQVYDNDNQAFIPQLWAQESLAILEENMVAAQLVHRDFEETVAQFGDTVNTRRPGQFVANRKTDSDQVVVQDATATNIQVVLNQWAHVSFIIKDGEESKSFKDLVAEYLAPAMLAQARLIDQVVLGQAIQFLPNTYGGAGQLSSSNAKATILGTRNIMNRNKAYVTNRNLILAPNSETSILNLDSFLQAFSVGDDGTALREASLGRKLGFDMYMCQNTMSVPSGVSATSAGAINHSGGYLAGTTSALVVNGITGIITTGTWLLIAGDNIPYQVTAHSETSGNTTSITLDRALVNTVANSAVITFYTPATVNLSGGYAAAWAKGILTNFSSGAPSVGQPVTFNTDTTNRYTIVQVSGTAGAYTIVLDRPLVNAISNSDAVNVGPAADYNFAFHRNALALICRPLALPRQGAGALSAVVNFNDLSMRATISYQGMSQGHLVTLDMLFGTAILDYNLGAIMLG